MKEVEFYRTMLADPAARATKLEELRYIRRGTLVCLLFLGAVILGYDGFLLWNGHGWRALLPVNSLAPVVFCLWIYSSQRSRVAALEAMGPTPQVTALATETTPKRA